jgi:ribosomal protein L29
MATKEAPKKSTQKATKSTEKLNDFSTMKTEDINKLIVEKRNDLMEFTKSLRGGELVNPSIIKATRKEIARALTALNASKEEK